MKQLTLGLTHSPRIATYSKVALWRSKQWEARGFSLLNSLREELNEFNTGQDQQEALTTLSNINYLCVEIGTLDPRWLSFSTYVFIILLDYNPLKKSIHAKRLLRKFSDTLEALYGQHLPATNP